MKDSKVINRYFTITKSIFFIISIAYLVYFYLLFIRLQYSSFQEFLTSDVNATINFIVTISNLFTGYLLIFIHRKVKEGNVEYGVLNLFLLFIAQIFFKNIWCLIILGFLIYKMITCYNITIFKTFKDNFNKNFLVNTSGSLIINFFALICLIASARIG